MRSFKCLNTNFFSNDKYSLVPIRDEDKFSILQWRNEQIDILRQKEILTIEQQIQYYKSVVDKIFEEEKPNQLLWSFLLEDKLIGYGGLVHIDWEAKHGEISFVLCNERNTNHNLFKNDWKAYLVLLEKIAFDELKFNKIHTYAYDIRDYYFEVMFELGFNLEARLKQHILIKGKLEDILILSKFNTGENPDFNR